MDHPVNARLLLCLATLALHGAAPAQALNDPTRPPASLYTPAVDPDAAPASKEPQLQSVLIARHAGGRHVAVIDGQTVRLGEQFRGARVARMTQHEVVLVNGKERRVLRLFPPAASPQRHNESNEKD
jgi:MSHA biogenesis protein MshK